MERERRFGMGPVPRRPRDYLTEAQVNGMLILKKFGWNLVCIRRPSITETTTIFYNSYDRTLGILGHDGILRISNTLKIRKPHLPAAS